VYRKKARESRKLFFMIVVKYPCKKVVNSDFFYPKKLTSARVQFLLTQIIHDAPQINKNVISGREFTPELLLLCLHLSDIVETIKNIIFLSFAALLNFFYCSTLISLCLFGEDFNFVRLASIKNINFMIVRMEIA
jgi:hypothetical protein